MTITAIDPQGGEREVNITTLEDLANFVNWHVEVYQTYPANEVRDACRAKGWIEGIDEWHIATDGIAAIMYADEECDEAEVIIFGSKDEPNEQYWDVDNPEHWDLADLKQWRWVIDDYDRSIWNFENLDPQWWHFDEHGNLRRRKWDLDYFRAEHCWWYALHNKRSVSKKT